MKKPLPWRKKPLNRAEAWACLAINLGVCPGLGSIMAGRWAGFGQVIVTAAGLALAMVGAAGFFSAWYQTLEMPTAGRPFWTGITGLLLFVGGWLWSLVTSIQLVKQTARPVTPSQWGAPPPP